MVLQEMVINKNQVYNFYDFTKGGMYIVDQLKYYYMVRSQSNRWDLVAFYILDTICVNSKTLFCIKKGLDVKKENTSDFLFN